MSSNVQKRPIINVRYCRREDLPQAARLFNKAFTTSEFHDMFLPGRHTYPHEYINFALHRFRTRFVQPNIRMVVAEDETGRLVGYATWQVEGESALARQWREGVSWWWTFERPLLKLEEWYMKYLINHTVDYPTLFRFRKLANENFEGLPPHMHLIILAVPPEQQGKGVGKAILRWGFKLAEKEQMPVVLESSRVGQPVYESVGFKMYKTVDMSHEKEGEIKIPVMLWEPSTLRGTFLEEDGQGGWKRKPHAETLGVNR